MVAKSLSRGRVNQAAVSPWDIVSSQESIHAPITSTYYPRIPPILIIVQSSGRCIDQMLKNA
jgi:hypothetical protein